MISLNSVMGRGLKWSRVLNTMGGKAHKAKSKGCCLVSRGHPGCPSCQDTFSSFSNRFRPHHAPIGRLALECFLSSPERGFQLQSGRVHTQIPTTRKLPQRIALRTEPAAPRPPSGPGRSGDAATAGHPACCKTLWPSTQPELRLSGVGMFLSIAV